MKIIYDNIGKNAFRNFSNGKFTKMFHPAIFDAISIAVSDAIIGGEGFKYVNEEQHIMLLKNNKFEEAIKVRTTNVDNIRTRINLAHDFLIEGVLNEE